MITIPERKINLPPQTPRYRSWLRLQKFIKNPIPFYNDTIKSYGDTYCFSLRYNKVNILTIDPEIIQHVLRKNSVNYGKPVAQTSLLSSFMGKGLLLSRGNYHEKQRQLMAPGFRAKQMDYLVHILVNELDRHFLQLDQRIEQNNFLDIWEEMKTLTFSMMAKAIFSTSLNEEQLVDFFQNYNKLQTFFSKIVRMPSLIRWYNWNGDTKRYSAIAHKNKKLILNIIAQRENQFNSPNDLLAMLMNARYEDGSKMSPEQLQEECSILFVAGHETAANVLGWMFYLLDQHRETAQKIKAEIQLVLGNSITFEGLMKMEYLTQFINESLRMYPPSWITNRVALNDDKIAGFDIPKGAVVIPFIYGLHHNEKLWDAPEKFQPERFETTARKKRHSFAHLPFGAGPRQCIGRNFAMIEMKIILIKFLQKYTFKNSATHQVALWPAVTLKPRYGIKGHLTVV